MKKAKIITVFIIIILSSGISIFSQDAVKKAGDKMRDAAEKTEPPTNSTVRGRVFYSDTGRPVRRSNISLIAWDRSIGTGEYSGLTDSDGYFQIKNVAKGTYYAFVNAPGVVSPLAYIKFMNREPSKAEKEEAVEKFTPIIVNGISDTQVQVSAIRGGAVSGRITYADGDVAVGVKVEIMRKVGGIFLTPIPNMSSLVMMNLGNSSIYQTDDRGMYRFPGLPEGEYIVKVTENISHQGENNSSPRDPFGMFPLGNNSLLQMYYPDVFEVINAQILKVGLGQEIYDINIIIPDQTLYQIGGQVIAKADKLPVAGIKILLRRKYDNTYSLFENLYDMTLSAVTDEKGRWIMRNVPKGTYVATINSSENSLDKNGTSYESSENANYATNINGEIEEIKPKTPIKKFAKTVKDFTIVDENLTDIIIELGVGGEISGKVTVENDNKKFPKSINIITFDEEYQHYGFEILGGSTDTDVDGESIKSVKKNFKLDGLPTDKLYLNVNVFNEPFYVKSVTRKGKDLLVGAIELAEGEKLTDVVVVLGTDVATIKGIVFDEDDKPLSKAEFAFIPTDPIKRLNPSYYISVETDKNGEFEAKVAPYEYAVIFPDPKNRDSTREEYFKWLNETFKDAQKIKLEAGKTESIEVFKPIYEK